MRKYLILYDRELNKDFSKDSKRDSKRRVQERRSLLRVSKGQNLVLIILLMSKLRLREI